MNPNHGPGGRFADGSGTGQTQARTVKEAARLYQKMGNGYGQEELMNDLRAFQSSGKMNAARMRDLDKAGLGHITGRLAKEYAASVGVPVSGGKQPGGGGGGSKPSSGSGGKSASSPPPKNEEERLHDAWSSKLSEDEKDAVRFYQGQRYESVNRVLREGAQRGDEDTQARIKELDGALRKAPGLSSEMTVYRGVGREYADDLKGGTIRDSAFLSTTANPKMAEGFSGRGGAVFAIQLPKGFKAGRMEGFSLEGHGEHEFLLPRGTALHITGTTTRGGVTTISAVPA